MRELKLKGVVTAMKREYRQYFNTQGFPCGSDTAGWIATVSVYSSRLSTSIDIPIEHVDANELFNHEVEVTVRIK